ncbi:hypothetical protein [Nitrococcus mobilis]|uniref:Uncharacterized protein n=1 Tax=Nitrococcus mobilis Nb-231 TaxID=314278 RepID=A4BNK4_9GAMM|nr:hypothetical protein [Nitrococcus mobilis]EAR22803.1 hypothetical protein NB231_10133 [Nitrococcus mobilis Nb-231]
MRKAILGLLAGLFFLGLVAGGSGVRQLHNEIHTIQQQWLTIKASRPNQSTVAQARALWWHTHDLQRRYADNPQVKVWENRTWYTYWDYLKQVG